MVNKKVDRASSIVTLTVNPALDVSSHVYSVSPDRKLRCSTPVYEPGGGGINVSRAIQHLGGASLAVWTCGGLVGKFLESLLDDEQVEHLPVAITGMTRQNFVVKEESSDRQYRFCHPGPTLLDVEQSRIAQAISGLASVPQYLVISGGPCPGMSTEFWSNLIDQVATECRIVVDSSGFSLGDSLDRPLFLYKSNIGELSQSVGHEITSDAELIAAAREMVHQGLARFVLTSLGSGGALLVSADEHFRLNAPTVPIISRVGAGDSMTAGLVWALGQGEPIDRSFMWGIAAGTAAVMTPGTQLCRRVDVDGLFEQLLKDSTAG